MVEFEADDALAAAAHLAAKDKRVEKICIWTPDKDLSQCVDGDRVVQIDRRSGQIRDEQGVQTKFGVMPRLIPDYLALVGDSADGYPGLAGYGPKTAAQLINRYGALEDFPAEVLTNDNRENALLFKDLATLRTDIPLFKNVNELEWKGATKSFPDTATRIDNKGIADKVEKLKNGLR
jgi:5'-3' exonuclease